MCFNQAPVGCGLISACPAAGRSVREGCSIARAHPSVVSLATSGERVSFAAAECAEL